jgi:hypothetical protein
MFSDFLQVWAVLKPGFLALLADPFATKPLDIIVFDVLPTSDGSGEGRVSLAAEIKERNPLRHSFKVSSVQFISSVGFSLLCFCTNNQFDLELSLNFDDVILY